MQLNIALCDDDENIIKSFRSMISNYEFQKDIDIALDIFNSGEKLLDSYKSNNKYALILLDIEMPLKDGISIADEIRNTYDRNVLIIFISSYPRYMQDSFSVHPFNFLQKPIRESELFTALNDVILQVNSSLTFSTCIISGDKEYKINIPDILYIKTTNAKKQLLSFYFSAEYIETKGKIRDWQIKLQDYGFCYCCKGILVNISHVHYLTKKEIILETGEALPLSRNHYTEIHNKFFNQVITSKHI